jgi:hypothetical protein
MAANRQPAIKSVMANPIANRQSPIVNPVANLQSNRQSAVTDKITNPQSPISSRNPQSAIANPQSAWLKYS